MSFDLLFHVFGDDYTKKYQNMFFDFANPYKAFKTQPKIRKILAETLWFQSRTLSTSWLVLMILGWVHHGVNVAKYLEANRGRTCKHWSFLKTIITQMLHVWNINLHLGHFWGVGKYSSTIEHLGYGDTTRKIADTLWYLFPSIFSTLSKAWLSIGSIYFSGVIWERIRCDCVKTYN